MNLAVVIDERQVLPLLRGERFYLVGCGNRDLWHDESLNSALKIIKDDGPVYATKNLEQRPGSTMVRVSTWRRSEARSVITAS